jgi:hypothetical protein
MAIENMQKDIKQTSTDFGRELRDQVKFENREKEKAFRKREDRKSQQARLIEVGTSVGLGLGNAYFQNKADAFLQTEKVTNDVLTTRTAYTISQATKATDAEANAYDGGVQAYWLAKGKERVKAELDKKFGTIRNETQYSNALLGAGSKAGEDLQAAHNQRLKLTNTYLSKRGVDEGKDVFLSELKKNNPTTVAQGITKFLGKYIGLSPNQQMNDRAKNILGSAAELTKFQETYKQTGDGLYSQIVATNTPKEFLNPVPVLGKLETREVDNPIPGGSKITQFYKEQVTTDRTTGRKSTLIIYYDANGKELTGEVTTKQQEAEVISYNSMVSGIMGSDSRSKAALMSANIFVKAEMQAYPEIRKELDDAVKAAVEARFGSKDTGSSRGDAVKEYGDLMNARIGGAARLIEMRTGMEYDKALHVALNMFIQDPKIDGSGAFRYGVNPYGVLSSVLNTTKDRKTRFSPEKYEALAGERGINFINRYVNGSKIERDKMDVMYKKIIDANRPESVPYDSVIMAQSVAKIIANKGRTPDTSLEEQISITEGFIQQGLDEAEKIKEIALEEKLRLDSSKGVLQADENPLPPVPTTYMKDALEWAQDNPAQATLFVASGLLVLAPLAVGGVAATGTAAIALGARALGMRASPRILQFIRQSFSKPKVDVPAPTSTATTIATPVSKYNKVPRRGGKPLSKEAQEYLKRQGEPVPTTPIIKETVAPLSVRKIAGAATFGGALALEAFDSEEEEQPSLLERPKTDITSEPASAPTVTSLISTALANSKGTGVVTPSVVNAVFDIETNASDPISVRAVEDSGHDAHGIGQVKTATAVQPGYRVESVFDIATRLGITFNSDLQNQAADQASKAFKPITGDAGKEVIRLLQIPEIGAAFSVSYLNAMNKRYKGDLEKVFLAYNQGPGVADNFKGDRSTLKKEGREYLEKAEKLGVL